MEADVVGVLVVVRQEFVKSQLFDWWVLKIDLLKICVYH